MQRACRLMPQTRLPTSLADVRTVNGEGCLCAAQHSHHCGLQDVAGRKIYEQRQPRNREDRDQDGRMAIGMDRIREHFGCLMADGAYAEADGGYLQPAAENLVAAAWSHEVEEDDAGEGGDGSRTVLEQEHPGAGRGFGHSLQGHAGISRPPHGVSGLLDIRNLGDGVL